MAESCIQGERLITLEMILKSMSETLGEQKVLSQKTYQVLTDISGHAIQIHSITKRLDVSEQDIQAAFKSLRRIDLRHATEDGVEEVEEKNSKFWDAIKQSSVPYIFVVIWFAFWVADKFNVFIKIGKLWAESKG